MKLRDIMSREIACLGVEDTVEKAAQLMKSYNVGSIPICSQNSVVGIITDRDIALRATAVGDDGYLQVRKVMTANPVVGTPDMDVDDAVRLMSENQIRRLPIVENNSLVGMVSLGDISVEPRLQDDAEIALKNISKPATNWFS
ncbi:MAG: CBS domain-containing protein [Tissierellia bacterium]|nr:CBS domain-containing protein [Tissierellia bacterium]MDD3226512.1 CBS domain-containing protein [Tissierellia bacterium]MDD4046343.1 CBS domain-containing protein [Tissierellia bacterium]